MSLNKLLDNKNVLYGGALICSLLGAILILIDDFAGWYWYIWGTGYGWGWIGFPSALENLPDSILIFPLFILASGGLFYCSIISLLGLINQENPPGKQLYLIGIILSLITVGICLLGGFIVAIEMIIEDLEFWYGGAFWGGVIGGVLTIIFMFFLWRE